MNTGTLLNPTELGYYEMRPGSGIWYRLGTKNNAYEPRICENPACGREFMGRRSRGGARFCSVACQNQWQRKVDADQCKINDDDCTAGRKVLAHGLCNTHYRRWWKHGDTSVVLPHGSFPRGKEHPDWVGDDITYRGMHSRIQQARGRANSCVNGCESTRYEWAHIHNTDPHDVENYQGMCPPCHNRYDHSELTWEQVEEIRALRYFGVPRRRLGKMYVVSEQSIGDITFLRTWVPEPICASQPPVKGDQ